MNKSYSLIKKTIFFWLLFSFFSIGIFMIDYYIRLIKGPLEIAYETIGMAKEGMPYEIILLLMSALGTTLLFMLYKQLRVAYKRKAIVFTFLLIHFLVGVAFFLALNFYYVLETGIDSL